MLSPALTKKPSEPDSEKRTVIVAVACWFWTMTLIRREGVGAWSRIVLAEVPTVKVAWVNARMNGEEMEMFDIKLVSTDHVDAIDLFLLAQDDVNGFDKGVLGFHFSDLGGFQLQLGLEPV
jgi:hypothetical protein